MPPGGEGFYYFSLYVTTVSAEFARFDLEVNGQRLCSAVGELNNMSASDEIVASCNGMAEVVEGKISTANISLIFRRYDNFLFKI